MNCAEFRKWLTARHHLGEADGAEAREHTEDCPACARLLRLDQAAEQAVRSGLPRMEAPAGLRAAIELIGAEPRRKEPRPVWFRFGLPAAAATGLLLLLLVLQPFGGKLTDLDQVARLAEKNHLAGLAMHFSAVDVSDVPAWFHEKLDFEVALPHFRGAQLELLGGRKCSLGRQDAAYLFYAGEGKPYSLFVLRAADVEFHLEEGKVYRYPLRNCIIEVWKEQTRVFVLAS